MNYMIIEIKQSLIISLPILLAGINLPEEPDKIRNSFNIRQAFFSRP